MMIFLMSKIRRWIDAADVDDAGNPDADGSDAEDCGVVRPADQ